MQRALLLIAFFLIPNVTWAKSCRPIREAMDFNHPVPGIEKSHFAWDRYEPKHEAKANILVLPGIGGATLTEEWEAYSLCRKGFKILVIQDFGHHADKVYDWGRQDRQTGLAVYAMQRLMDHYPGTYGLFGTSLGGIYGSTVLGLDKRIVAAVIVAGGGDLPSILAYSEEGHPKEFRAGLMERYGISTAEELERQLREHITIDPLKFARPNDGVKLLLVTNLKDKSVPTSNQEALWKAWGSQKRFTFPMGHISGIVSSHLVHHKQMIHFLVKALSPKNKK